MSNTGPFGNRRMTVPTPPQGQPIASYATYLEAQRAVDFLSDEHFPVQNVTIVGSGLQMVERVTGRLTYGRVAAAGAASGAWFGLFVGFILEFFGNGPVGALVAAIVIGAAFGMLFGVISYSLAGGRRDFTSTSQIVASEYVVLCADELAGQARQVLGRLPNSAGPARATGWPHAQRSQAQQTYPGPLLPPGAPPPAQPTQRPEAGTGEQAPSEPEQAPVSGPTYGEQMERQRRERQEAERLEAEQRVAELRAAQQKAAEQKAAEDPPDQPRADG